MKRIALLFHKIRKIHRCNDREIDIPKTHSIKQIFVPHSESMPFDCFKRLFELN